MRFGDGKPSLIHFLHKQEAQHKSLISRCKKSWARNGEKLMHNLLNLNTIHFAEWATAFRHFRSYMIWLFQTLNCEKKAILIILSLGREILGHRCPCKFYIPPLLSTAPGKSNAKSAWICDMCWATACTAGSLQWLNTEKQVPNNSVT